MSIFSPLICLQPVIVIQIFKTLVVPGLGAYTFIAGQNDVDWYYRPGAQTIYSDKQRQVLPHVHTDNPHTLPTPPPESLSARLVKYVLLGRVWGFALPSRDSRGSYSLDIYVNSSFIIRGQNTGSPAIFHICACLQVIFWCRWYFRILKGYFDLTYYSYWGGGGLSGLVVSVLDCGLTGLVYWGLTPQQQPGSYQGGEMMIMKSVFWWRKPEYPVSSTRNRVLWFPPPLTGRRFAGNQN